MKIAVIGSREFKNKELIEKEMTEAFRIIEGSRLDSKFTKRTLISGGARGVDSLAFDFAFKNDIYCEVIEPINRLNKINYLFRNVEIITKADKIIAFWDGKSKGTKFVIDYAKARYKDIKIIREK